MAVKQEKRNPLRVKKRTSIGFKHKPLNRSKRRNWKAYVGQGRPQ